MRIFISLLLSLNLVGCNSSMGIWGSRTFTGFTFGSDREHLGEVLGDIKISENKLKTYPSSILCELHHKHQMELLLLIHQTELGLMNQILILILIKNYNIVMIINYLFFLLL